MQAEPKPGTLYIVGTPIGNLEDMTFRAVRILQAVDIIAAEDTRHTGKLLQHFQVHTPQISYHEHNRTGRIPEILTYLHYGKAIALVSDAGMPGISDPGHELITACVAAGIDVVPIPGATAAITALSVSGLATSKFVFDGFLPAKRQHRREYLATLLTETRTLVFYESPHRLRETLEDLGEILGGSRTMVMARELTKLYEEIWRGDIKEAIAYYREKDPQGEYTLVVGGASPSQPEITEAQLRAELLEIIKQGVSRSQASRQLAQETSISRRYLYQLALSIDQEGV